MKRVFSARPLRKLLPLAGIAAGAVACGLWLQSSAAGLFAFFVLFLLGRIARSLDDITRQLKAQPAAPFSSPSRGSAMETTTPRQIYISTKAVERLRPWVEDEGPLTEESAKAYCAVLLDTLAILHPRLAGRAREESWS